ncbi:MAG: hypothetical protein ABJA82_05115 [Myxococcales bacterium]
MLSACALMSVGVIACDAQSIQAVGSAGGVYRPDQGCTLVEEADQCPGPGAALPQLRFETPVNPGVATDAMRGTLSDPQVSCRHSFCGTGSLATHAELAWNDDPAFPQRAASFKVTLPAARDLMGRTVSFAVYVPDLTVPMHAQIGVIFDHWRYVQWAPLAQGWNRVSGVVSPANTLTKIDAAVTSIPVTSLQIDVFVPVNTVAGTKGSWSGDIYLDDIAW